MHQHDGHEEMIREMRAKWLWTNATVMLLGLWLVSSPFTFGYESRAMLWSDVASGVLLFAFAALAVVPRFDSLGRWTVALVGVWLQFAPLVFWAPTAATYLNNTLVGALAIALSILVPKMPGAAHHKVMMKPGPEVPPGWSYNPSTWHQRAPMIGLAFVGWLTARYLAAFQLGYIDRVWEPFFGEGTVRVLTSEVSEAFPVSDAGLGAVAYTLELLMAWMGGKTRWRTMPWMVTFFFVLVVPLGLTHIVLVILQPVAVGYWCTLCLLAAALMLAMIPFTVDEAGATVQFMWQRVREGKPFWRTFLIGDTMEGGEQDGRTPSYGGSVAQTVAAARWGVTVPWTLGLSAAIGLWLMLAPVLLGTAEPLAHSEQVAGALVIVVAVIATAEVIRTVRLVNILLGLWVLVAPWGMAGASSMSRWNAVVCGLLLMALSLPRGAVRERYGSWNRFIV